MHTQTQTHTYRHRHTQKETQTDRDRDTGRDTDTDTHTHATYVLSAAVMHAGLQSCARLLWWLTSLSMRLISLSRVAS